MNNTTMNINQAEPELVYKVNAGAKIYITREYDPFRIVHCFEAPLRDYIIHGETKDGDKKILFSAINHFKCCNCCDQCIVGYLCCGYACCHSIQFQMDLYSGI